MMKSLISLMLKFIGKKIPPPATRAVIYQEGENERKDKYGKVA